MIRENTEKNKRRSSSTSTHPLQPIKSVIIIRKAIWNMMKIQEAHAQLNNFSLCNSIKPKINFQQSKSTKDTKLYSL